MGNTVPKHIFPLLWSVGCSLPCDVYFKVCGSYVVTLLGGAKGMLDYEPFIFLHWSPSLLVLFIYLFKLYTFIFCFVTVRWVYTCWLQNAQWRIPIWSFCFVSLKFEVGNKFVLKVGISSQRWELSWLWCWWWHRLCRWHLRHVALLAFLTIFFPSHNFNNK